MTKSLANNMPPTEQSETTRSKPTRPMKILQYSLASIALCIACTSLYLSDKWHRVWQQSSQQLTLSTTALQQQQVHSHDEISTLLKETSQAQQNLTDKVDVINQHLQQVLHEQSYKNDDWLLLKVRYYLELAQINAHWSDQNDVSVALLQAADSSLNQIHDEQITPIRQSIAQEMMALNARPHIDMTHILSSLDALQNQILQFPDKKLPVLPDSQQTTTPISTDLIHTNLHAVWESSMTQLKKLLVIQHHDKPLEPPMSVEYQALLRESIRFNLQQAQWALLRLNQDIFHVLLSQAISNIKRNFDAHDATVANVLQELTNMHSLTFKKPSLSLQASLSQLNQLLNTKQTLHPPTTLSAPTDPRDHDTEPQS